MSNSNEEFNIKVVRKPRRIIEFENELAKTFGFPIIRKRKRGVIKQDYFPPLPSELVKKIEESGIKKCFLCGSTRITIKEGFFRCKDCKGPLGEVK